MSSNTYDKTITDIVVHGPSIPATRPYGDDGYPIIKVSVRCVLTTSSSGSVGAMDISLNESQPGYAFSYYINMFVGIQQSDGSIKYYQSPVSKPEGLTSWGDGIFDSGRIDVATNKTNDIGIYVGIMSNCPCRTPNAAGVYAYYTQVDTIKFDVYNTPSTPVLSIDGSTNMFSNGSIIKFNYTEDTNYNNGIDTIQYSIDKSSYTDYSGSDENAGSFSYELNIGNGKSITMYCRRRLTRPDRTSLYSEWSNGVLVNTYSTPNVTVNFKVSNTETSIINGNTIGVISWNSWNGSGSETATTMIYLVDSTDSEQKIIQTVTSSSLTSNILSYLYTPTYEKLYPEYDNKSIYIKVVRTNTYSESNSGTGYKEIKIRFNPISKINTPTSPKEIYSDKLITWSYPSGYNGIVNGYRISFYYKESDPIPVFYEDVSTARYNIPISKLQAGTKYYIGITPYYVNRSIDRNIEYRSSDFYVQYLANAGKPNILYPVSGGYWNTINSAFRIVIQLPEDSNIPSGSSTSDYRYKDVEVKLTSHNGGSSSYTVSSNSDAFSCTTNTLTYRRTIIFNPKIAKFSYNNTITYIQARVKGAYSNSFGDWSDTISVLRLNDDYSTSIGKDLPILADDINKISMFSGYMATMIDGSLYHTILTSRGSIITKSFLDTIYENLKLVSDSTKDIICDSGHDMKYPEISSNEAYTVGDIINYNGYIKLLLDTLKSITDVT